MDDREVRSMMEDISVVMKTLVINATAPLVARIESQQAELDALKPKQIDPVEVDRKMAGIRTDCDKTIAPLLSEIAALKTELDALKAKQPDPAEIDRRLEAMTVGLKADAEQARAAGKEKRKAALAQLKTGILAECETIVSAKAAATVATDIRKDIDVLRSSVEALPKKAPELPDIPAMIAAANADLKRETEKDFEAIASDVQRLRDIVADPEITPTRADVAKQIDESLALSEGRVLMQTNDMIDKRVALEVAALPPAEKGKDADPELVASLVKSEAERILAGWQRPQDGKSVTAEELVPLIEDRVQRAFSAIPVSKDGKDGVGVASAMVDRSGNLVLTSSDGTTKEIGRVVGADGRDGANGSDGLPGRDGKDAEPVTRDELLHVLNLSDAIPVAVQQWLEANPPAAGKEGVDGKDGVPGRDGIDGKEGTNGLDGKDGSPGLNGKDGADGLHGKDGRDAIDLADMLVVEGGDVVATFTDGRTKVLGPFRGKDGEPGLPGKDADIAEIERVIAEKVAKIQPPEIERDAYMATITKMIEEAVSKQSTEVVEEFAPDEVAANVALSIKMMAERPLTRTVEPEHKAQPSPTINIALSDNREPPVVNVGQPNVIIEAKRTKERTTVTGWDKSGRISEFEKTEVDE